MSNPLFPARLGAPSTWSPLQKKVALFGLMAAIPGLNLILALPAQAHHAMDGNLPSTLMEGLLSGLAHPVIGVDHLLFVIATGLLAIASVNGLLIPIAFVFAGLIGTGLHLMGLNLPAPELLVSSSVVIFGLLLALRRRPEAWVIAGLAAIAGIFHGYAYGESIVGAEVSPLFAYLIGFSVIQLAIAWATYMIGRQTIKGASNALQSSGLALRFSGFAILGAGTTLLSSILLG